MKILIADDEEILRELLKETLTKEGYNVITASDGKELIKLALEDKPDLIITDIQMPNISGDTVIAMIEEYEDLSQIPVIIITGMSETTFKQLGVSRSIEVVTKPIDLEKLKFLISKYNQQKK